MNHIQCGVWCAACVLCSLSAQADEPVFQEALSPESLRARVEYLDAEIREISKILAESRLPDHEPLTTESRIELVNRLSPLNEEVDRLQAELGYGTVVSVSDPAVAARGALFAAPPQVVNAEPELPAARNEWSEQTGIELSGFMDAVYQSNVSDDLPNRAYLNQVEVDFARSLSPRARASLGVVYADGFRIGSAVIAFDLIAESEENVSLVRTWSVGAGQFDAPFGEDVNSYPSNVRKSVSVPLAVAGTHAQWNDVGAYSTLSLGTCVVDGWAVQCYQLQTNAALEEPVANVTLTSGSRANLELIKGLRVGASGAGGWFSGGGLAFELYGAHAVANYKTWSLTGEVISSHERVPLLPLTRQGSYLQLLREFAPGYVFARSDHLEGSDIDLHRGLSVGGGLSLAQGLELRAEFQASSHAPDERSYMQLVATF